MRARKDTKGLTSALALAMKIPHIVDNIRENLPKLPGICVSGVEN